MNTAQKEARKLLDRFSINEIPVPVELIAENLGVILSYQPFEGKDDISGVLYRDRDNTIIGINSFHSETRQRFSIAHEIGHLILHNKKKKKLFVNKAISVNFRNSISSLATNREEIAANAFAAELLMPEDYINSELMALLSAKKDTITKEELIYSLAGKFDVSPQAMEYRLMNLGYINAH